MTEETEPISDVREKAFTEVDMDAETEKRLRLWADDACVGCYLSAHKSPNAAVKHLKATLQWRMQKRPEQITCSKCEDSPTAHDMRLIGFDSAKRAVFYTTYRNARSRWDVSSNREHLLSSLEGCIRLGKKFGWSEQWIWVVDYTGFGLRDCDPRSMKLTNILLAHYPERLHHAFMVDAPRIFSGSWKVVRPLLDEVTVGKISFVTSSTAPDIWRGVAATKTDSGTEAQCVLGEEMAEWLTAEMALTRDTKRKGKMYWEPSHHTPSHNSVAVPSFLESEHFSHIHVTDAVLAQGPNHLKKVGEYDERAQEDALGEENPEQQALGEEID